MKVGRRICRIESATADLAEAIVRPPYLTVEDIAYLFPRTAMRAMADVALRESSLCPPITFLILEQ